MTTKPSKVLAPTEKRRPPNAGKGRVKGVPNKITADVKAMILQALSGAGGVKYLQRQANKNPASFLTLVGKVLPLQVTGKDGADLKTVTRIEVVAVAASHERDE